MAVMGHKWETMLLLGDQSSHVILFNFILFLFLFIYLFKYLFIYLFTYLFIYLFRSHGPELPQYLHLRWISGAKVTIITCCNKQQSKRDSGQIQDKRKYFETRQNTHVYNLLSIPQITRLLLGDAIMSSKADPRSNSKKGK